MRIDKKAIDTLMENLEEEGEAKLYFPGDDVRPGAPTPPEWIDMLKNDPRPADFIDIWWKPVRPLLPLTIDLLKRKTSCIAASSTKESALSLIYCFGTDESLYASRGFLPHEGELARYHGHRLPAELETLYRVHDGWVDFFSGDGGPAPVAEWNVLGREGRSPPPFLQIYFNGSDTMGFDLSAHPLAAYALHPDDEEVESIENVWEWLDDALSGSLEDLDDA